MTPILATQLLTRRSRAIVAVRGALAFMAPVAGWRYPRLAA